VLQLPAAYGGLDLTPTEGIAVFEELAQADASVAWCVGNGNTHWVIAQLTPDAARTIHGDADVITANSTRPSGRADAVAGGYRVSGRWSLVSGCELAAWMVLLCVVHENGTPRRATAGPPDMRFMIVPASVCEIVDTWSVGGLRGTGSHDVVVREVFVPDGYCAGLSDPYVLREPRYRIPPPSRVGPGLGAMALGVARSALEAFKEIAGAKVPQQIARTGPPERATQMLRDNHGAQTRVSQAEALVRSSRLFLFDSLERLWSMLMVTGEVTTEAARDFAARCIACCVQRCARRRPSVRRSGCDLALYELPPGARLP
jgi:alkylation response protein AidB-like acyl-CoA dehydrogenase